MKSSEWRFYVYRGLERDYIVIPCRFCSCYDFLLNVLIRKRKVACYHVIGFEIARLNNALIEVEVCKRELSTILSEIMVFGKSNSLRKYV